MSTKTKHTPGPWTAAPNAESGGYSIWCGADTPAEEGIAATLVGTENEEANARLIAAAPDLLAFAEWAVSLISAEYPQQQEVWLEQGRAAIAKAKETTP